LLAQASVQEFPMTHYTRRIHLNLEHFKRCIYIEEIPENVSGFFALKSGAFPS
jgi:hypothetical protein